MATGVVFNLFKQKLLEGAVNFTSDTIKCALFASTLTPNIDTQEFFSDISANELATAGGYTAGGATLASKTVTTDDTDNEGVLDCADIEWTADGSGFTCRYAVLYKDTGDPATSLLIGYWDFGGDQNPVSVAFNLVINAEGLLNIG